jgi:hypothetical protein
MFSQPVSNMLKTQMGSGQQADGGLVGAIQNAMRIAGQVAVGGTSAALKQLTGPVGEEIGKIEFLLWKRMLYEHSMWLDKGRFDGLDQVINDLRFRMGYLQSQAPQVRQAFITIFSTAGLDAAIQYRKALRAQIPDAFFWATAM